MNARPVMANLGGKLPPNNQFPLPPRPEAKPDQDQVMVEKVLETAYSQLGKPYRCGGTSPKTGFDCSGYVQWVYGEHGIEIPRTSRDQLKHAGIKVAKEDILPGDVLVFYRRRGSRGTHVGIYVGDGKFLHSPHTGDVIKESKAFGSYWRPLFIEARRVLNIAPGKKLTPEQKEQIYLASSEVKKEIIRQKRQSNATPGYYRVKKGDTPSGIAKRYGISTKSLLAANNIRSSHSLRIGQKIKLPGIGVAAQGSSEQQEPLYHIVKKGQTPSGIAQRYHVSTKALMAANNLGSGRSVLIGQKLKIPGGRGDSLQAQGEPTPRSPKPAGQSPPRYHIVRKGEVPYNIALKYNVSPRDLMAANHLGSGRSVLIGQKLIIPGGDAQAVAPLETAAVSMPEKVAVSKPVKVSVSKPEKIAAPPKTAQTPRKHVVKRGEIPSVIAQRYGVSTKAIMEANKLSNGRSLKVGQALTIPAYGDLAQHEESSFGSPLEVFQIYEVKQGDVASKIAGKFGISVVTLMKVNNLGTNHSLRAGQKLRIPPTSKPAVQKQTKSKYYQVKPGDSVWVIAGRLDVPAQRLLDVNGLNPKSVLRVGQKLSIP